MCVHWIFWRICNYCVHNVVRSQGLVGRWKVAENTRKLSHDFPIPFNSVDLGVEMIPIEMYVDSTFIFDSYTHNLAPCGHNAQCSRHTQTIDREIGTTRLRYSIGGLKDAVCSQPSVTEIVAFSHNLSIEYKRHEESLAANKQLGSLQKTVKESLALFSKVGKENQTNSRQC